MFPDFVAQLASTTNTVLNIAVEVVHKPSPRHWTKRRIGQYVFGCHSLGPRLMSGIVKLLDSAILNIATNTLAHSVGLAAGGDSVPGCVAIHPGLITVMCGPRGVLYLN